MTGDLIRSLTEIARAEKSSLSELAAAGTGDIGDIFKDTEDRAEADDTASLAAAKDNAQPSSMKALSDAVMQAIPLYARAIIDGESIPEKASDQRKAVDRIRMNFDIALHQFRSRMARHSMSGEGIEARIARGIAAIEYGRPLCESYIEEILLPWLVFEDYGQICEGPVVVHRPKDELRFPDAPLVIIPQFACVKFRLDFALVAKGAGVTRIVAVECDGAAFHNADRDLLRDAYMAALGIPTVRVDARELRDHPRRASQRAARAISDLIG